MPSSPRELGIRESRSRDSNALYTAIATVRVVAAATRVEFAAMNRAVAVRGSIP